MTSLMITSLTLVITYIVLNRISMDIKRQEVQDHTSKFESIRNNAEFRSYYHLEVLKRSHNN